VASIEKYAAESKKLHTFLRSGEAYTGGNPLRKYAVIPPETVPQCLQQELFPEVT
jgi:hypothetical protein